MRLLHKTLLNYLFFSIIVFLLSIPVFYFLVQNLWSNDVDESLIYQKEKIIEGLKTGKPDLADIETFTQNAEKLGLNISITPLNEFTAALDSFHSEAYRDPDRKHVEPFREMVSYAQVDGKCYKITIRKDLVESADLILEIVLAQAFFFLILLTISLIFNHLFSKKIWSPFYDLVSKVKAFRIDKQEPLVAESSPISEFNELGEAIERLTENSIRTFRSQKEFTENAAHETQTPLTIIKNQVDLLAQDENMTQPQSEIITRIDRNVRILSKLNRNLLLLARIENEQYYKTEQTQISAIVAEICLAFEEEISMKKLHLSRSIKPDVLIISNSYLVHSLITNLITNALRHNIPHGEIEILLDDKHFGITNSGPGHSLDESRIFERFYSQQNSGGSGLGLAIAKKICLALGYELFYRFSGDNRHSFIVRFS